MSLVSDYIQQVLNAGHVARIDQFLAPNFVSHTAPPGQSGDRESVKHGIAQLGGQFEWRIDHEMPEGDRIIVRWTAYTTSPHEPYANGRSIYRVENGKIVEHWCEPDGDPEPWVGGHTGDYP